MCCQYRSGAVHCDRTPLQYSNSDHLTKTRKKTVNQESINTYNADVFVSSVILQQEQSSPSVMSDNKELTFSGHSVNQEPTTTSRSGTSQTMNNAPENFAEAHSQVSMKQEVFVTKHYEWRL